MIIVENAVISDDIKEKFFVCNLDACKGACCVEGDAGAPLEEEETKILERIYPKVEPYITEEGRKVIKKQGAWVIDREGDMGTPTIGENAECAYTFRNKEGILKCGIEQAYIEGEIDFKKPISCHMYPIRITSTILDIDKNIQVNPLSCILVLVKSLNVTTPASP